MTANSPCPKCGGKLVKLQTLVPDLKMKCVRCRAEFFIGQMSAPDKEFSDFTRERFQHSNAH